MRTKLIRNQNAFSLTELLIGTGLLGLLALGSSELLVRLNRTSSGIISAESAKVEVLSSLDVMGATLFNAAPLQPKEGLLADGDALYKGLAGMASGASFPFCRFEAGGASERFSIARVSAIRGRVRTETTLRPWNESSSDKIRLSFHSEAGYPFQPGATVPEKEILLIDGDNLSTRRYRVKRADHIVTDREPYADVQVPGATYEYTELTVEPPPLPNAASQARMPISFISGSTAYVASTQVLCVAGDDGTLIAHDEATGQRTVIYDPRPDKVRIETFNISYFATKSGAILDPSSYGLFPGTIDAIDCINAAMITLELKDQAGSARTLRRQKQVLLNNYNIRRPMACR
ncbi:MAG: hypothetical protein NDJ89_03610 [Oligoflexia bacterium]|nr:hypothetical protein [Oligoflexia bacterium]